MSYFVKNLVQNEYEQKFEGVDSFVVVETTGITGVRNNVMRGELKKKGIRMSIVKNSLMRRMLTDHDMAGACGIFAVGQCAVAYGGDSVVDVAKEMVVWAKKYDCIKLKGAYVDGSVMMGEAVKDLAKMPTRVELQGQVVQLALSPGSNLAGAIVGPGSRIAGCIKSLIEKLEEAA